MGAGGFLAEVTLQPLLESDQYVRGRDTRQWYELTDLYCHPKRRGRGWATKLVQVALTHARRHNRPVFLRVIPYGNKECKVAHLTAMYKQAGFKPTRADPREMVIKWPS